MKSPFIFAWLFSLALFADTIGARKDPGEHWQGLMRNNAVVELDENIVDVSKVTSISTTKNHCHNPTESRSFEPKPEYEKSFTTDFEPRPDATTYDDHVKPQDKKSFMKNFEPRPEDKKYFATDFESRPDATAYDDDVKPQDKKSFMKNFEPRPNLSAYSDDVKRKDEKSFTKNFEPRPNATAHDDDVKPEDKKSFMKNFEPRPNGSTYNDYVVGANGGKEGF